MDHKKSIALMAKVHQVLLEGGPQPTRNIKKIIRPFQECRERTWTRGFLRRATKYGFIREKTKTCIVDKELVRGSDEIIWEAVNAETKALVVIALARYVVNSSNKGKYHR